MGGSPDRMKKLADRLVEELPYNMPTGHALCNIAGGSDRYVLYKVGPVLTASVSMMLHRCTSLKLVRSSCDQISLSFHHTQSCE